MTLRTAAIGASASLAMPNPNARSRHDEQSDRRLAAEVGNAPIAVMPKPRHPKTSCAEFQSAVCRRLRQRRS
jgi:hypothetical protein